MVQYTCVLTNESEASTDPLTIIALDDSLMGDVLPDAEAAWGGTIILDPGESFTFTFDRFVSGNPGEIHRNVLTVTGKDDEGNKAEASDSADVFIVQPGTLTDSSLCVFDRDPETEKREFRLIFTPDITNSYKLNASNPGQFFYNILYGGLVDDPAEPGDTVTFTITLPYPFVTQGAMPLHLYSSVGLCCQDKCFLPGDEVMSFQVPEPDGAASPGAVTLEDYGPCPIVGVTTYTFSVEVTVPDTRLIYLNMHMDYGLKGPNTDANGDGEPDGYHRNLDDDAIPNAEGLSEIPNDGLYEFSHTEDATGTGWADGVYNINAFKRLRGFGGLVLRADSSPVEGATVEVIDPKGTVVDTMTTDVDGWYLSSFVHKGKETLYTVKLVGYPALSQKVYVKSNRYVQVDFTVP
jgi:hypothetical protein